MGRLSQRRQKGLLLRQSSLLLLPTITVDGAAAPITPLSKPPQRASPTSVSRRRRRSLLPRPLPPISLLDQRALEPRRAQATSRLRALVRALLPDQATSRCWRPGRAPLARRAPSSICTSVRTRTSSRKRMESTSSRSRSLVKWEQLPRVSILSSKREWIRSSWSSSPTFARIVSRGLLSSSIRVLT